MADRPNGKRSNRTSLRVEFTGFAAGIARQRSAMLPRGFSLISQFSVQGKV
jgi:hypothetical protein